MDTQRTHRRPWLDHYDYWVPAHMNYPRRSLYDILRTTAVETPALPAVSFLGADYTFAEIKQHADALARALVRMGIVKGDRIGIMLPNCPQYVIAAFAVLRLGAVIVNINPSYTPREVRFAADDSGIKMLVTLDALAPAAVALIGQRRPPSGAEAPPLRPGAGEGGADAPPLQTVIVTSLAEYSKAKTPVGAVEGAVRLADLLSDATPTELPRLIIDADDDLAVLQYTGGTTGVPKAAMLTHRNIFANVVQMQLWMRQSMRRGEERFLLVIPYFHIYGLTVGLMLGTWMGARQIQIPKYDVESVLAAIRDYRPTYFPAVPTIYVSLLNHPKLLEYGIEHVRTYNSGSAPLPMEVLERFERTTGVVLNQGYGLSEASPVTHSSPQLARRKPSSIGLPLPDTDMKIVDIETGLRDVDPGDEGELCISGPQVMKGYWNRPDESAIALRQDSSGRTWLYTGDVARMDEDGFTYIVQRKKDMIIVDGFNVYPSDVEGVIYTHQAVMECAVVGVPHEYHGEVVKAVVVLKPGMSATSEELMTHCTKSLVEYKRPYEVEIRPALPKSSVGKVLYTVLREQAAAGRAQKVSG